MKKHVRKHYHGPVEFVLKEDLIDSTYQDTKRYRYLLDKNTSSNYYRERVRYTRPAPNSPAVPIYTTPMKTTTSQYHLLDREKGVRYQSQASSSFFGALIRTYIIQLENQRAKNLGQ